MSVLKTIQLQVNDRQHSVAVDPATPLLYVLIDDLALNGPRFGCGLAQCGSCSVLVDGKEQRSCVTPVGSIGTKSITTLEGLAAKYARDNHLPSKPALHPLQTAMIEEQSPQCGFCYNGMVVKGSELLAQTPSPTDAQIRTAMNGHLCRCGTYTRVAKAIKRASKAIAEAT
jgi:aerobic-type carbon monoxide dehydrogenase small subunit (CoxS/CutS family)